jgi:hypothetical protein
MTTAIEDLSSAAAGLAVDVAIPAPVTEADPTLLFDDCGFPSYFQLDENDAVVRLAS